MIEARVFIHNKLEGAKKNNIIFKNIIEEIPVNFTQKVNHQVQFVHFIIVVIS